jgi:guanylate cyclase
MAAAGIRRRVPTPATLPAGEGLSLRVGIDSGPAVAGVIGRTTFGYDL